MGLDELGSFAGGLEAWANPYLASKAVFFAAVFLGAYAACFVAFEGCRAALRIAGRRAPPNIHELFRLVAAQNLALFGLVVAAYAAIADTFPAFEFGGRGAWDLLLISFVAIGGRMAANVVDGMLNWYGKANAFDRSGIGAQPAGKGAPLPGISWVVYGHAGKRMGEFFPMLRTVAAFAIYLLTAAAILGLMGIEIAPLIAGLGIAGIAVALALQDTLTNFFAGLYLLADKPVRLGDAIRISDGNEGTLVEVGWRSSKIRLFDRSNLIIPNSQLAQEKIKNYTATSKTMMVRLDVGVAYGSNLEAVERAIRRAVHAAKHDWDGAITDPEPVIRLVELGDFALKYQVFVEVEGFEHAGRVRHAVYKAILREFKKERVEIPFPTHTSFVRRE